MWEFKIGKIYRCYVPKEVSKFVNQSFLKCENYCDKMSKSREIIHKLKSGYAHSNMHIFHF